MSIKFRNWPYKEKPGSRPTSSMNPNEPKKTIDSTGDPSINGFFAMIVVSAFKKFVFAPTFIKVGIYMGTLIVCSLIRDFNLIGNDIYFAQKNNIFNVYFVKMGWLWTLLVCVPFVLMTSVVYTGFNKFYIRNNIARLVVATAMWFVFTTIFDQIDQKTGKCMLSKIKTKHECKSKNHEWLNGFDISGHTFILMHALFLMLEEVKVFNKWEELRRKLEDMARRNEFPTPSSEKAHYYYQLLTPYIKANFVVMAALTLLWEIMLLSTFLYFHTFLHKVIAASFAVIVWFCTYRVWYSSRDMFMSPGMPGNGIDKILHA